MKKKIGLTKNGIEEECTILDGTCRRHTVHRSDTLTKSKLSLKDRQLLAQIMELNSDRYTDSTGFEIRTHHPSKCAGQNCSIHNPSNHALNTSPTVWNGETKMMERVCKHGKHHPDRDDVNFHVGVLGENEDTYAAHECDGCCGMVHVSETKSHVTLEKDLLPWTGMSLKEARSKLSGLHFAKESLTDGEREILYIAEALLRRVDEINDTEK